MKKNALTWILAAVVLLVFLLLAWLLPGWIHATGARAIILRIGLIIFGLVAAALLYFYLAARAKNRGADKPVEGDATDQLIVAAEAQLGRSAAVSDARIGRLPLAIVLGAAGSTKTSIVMHSGLDAELLAGEVYRGEATVPTDPVNVWYAQGSIVLEAGGKLLEDAERWKRFVRHLQPRRLAAAFGRGSQAPRLAIVCFACDEFLKPGAAETVAASARKVRARLGEISQKLGIKLPVYVLFTRADRLPFFTDYVRSLSPAEPQQTLGATLPIDSDTSGAWAERESMRLNRAFGRMVHALSLRRLDVLSRETQDEVRAGAYEFPRELSKISNLAVQFLIDVARPSQLGVNPFLRGFYFTGVRPVIRYDAAVEAPRPAAGPAGLAAGATSVFDPRALQAAMAPAAARTGGRKVPEWVFLHRLFREVILSDEAVFKVTSGGTRVDLLRRGLIGAAAAACLLLSLGLTVSFIRNESLLSRSRRAVTKAASIGGVPGTLGENDLAQLDTLRELNARLASHERDGRPLGLRFGLYTGDNIRPKLRKVYFDRFRLAMWNDTRDRLNHYLRGLPDTPNDDSDFGRAQDALAAHLLTTSENKRSTSELLVPVLMTFWGRSGEPDSARVIAQRQFDFFAHELPHENPYNDAVDREVVSHTQRFLRAFGREAYYRALVYSASSNTQSVRYLGPTAVVRNDAVIPGAFTLSGYKNVLANLDSVENLFKRYDWIYGSEPPANKPTKQELETMYRADYVRRWQEYLARGGVEGFTSAADATSKLSQLGSPSSPLFSMLAVAARETSMDSLSPITRAFQPLHATVVPNDPKGVTAKVLGYTQALGGLTAPLTAMQTPGPTADAAMIQASTAAAAVKQEVGTLAANFILMGDAAATAAQIQRLLRQPADFADALITSLPGASLNAAARQFCSSSVDPLAARFPFNATSRANAAPAEVAAFFKKDEGGFWAFYQDKLQTRLTPQGRVRPGQNVRSDFASFFARAADFSNAMFRDGALSLIFDFQPEIPAGASDVTLQVDGDRAVYSPTSRASRDFVFEPERSQEAKLTVTINREVVTVAAGEGPWSVFRLFQNAQWGSSSPYRVEWRVPGRNVTVVGQVSFETGVPPVLRPGYLAPIAQCTTVVPN